MNTPETEQRSLFGEILDWMLTPLLLLWPASLGLTWIVAQSIADKPFDRLLENHVQTLAQWVVPEGARIRFAPPPTAHQMLQVDDIDQLFYQVIAPNQQWLAGDRQLPAPPASPPKLGQVQLRDDTLGGEAVRVASLVLPANAQGSQTYTLQVAETREKRSLLATEIIKGVLLPQFIILPIAVLLVWFAMMRGIRPLHQLQHRVRGRAPDDLSPLEEESVPIEVVPLVSSVNDLLSRLRDSIATQKRFLADAAHQLKTPLAGLKMQADLAQRGSSDLASLKKSLSHISAASMQATHTVNQLLALARAEGGGQVMAQQSINMVQLAHEVVSENVPRALAQSIDLGYDGAPPDAHGVHILGNATLLKELLRNLIDNAFNYAINSNKPNRDGRNEVLEASSQDLTKPLTTGQTTPQTVVTVRILPEPYSHCLLLQVEDNGPGIPEAEHDLVLQPFYRSLGNAAPGSGLGLAIVKEIAQKHSAELTLSDTQPHHTPPGLQVNLRFKAVG